MRIPTKVFLLLFDSLAVLASRDGIHARQDDKVSVSRLQVEGEDAPLGIDIVPRFSWVVSSTEKNVIQESYRLKVSSADNKDVWDSGVVTSSLPYGHEFSGSTLESDTEYSWTVDIVTNVGSTSASSTFATGFLDASDWGESAWIGKTAAASSPHSNGLTANQSFWIWTSEMNATTVPAGSRPFRKTITSPEGKAALSLDMIITVDNDFEFFVNGVRAGISPEIIDPGVPDHWRHAQRFNVTLDPSQDTSVLAVRGINLPDASTGGDTPAALLAAILVKYDDGSTDTFISDESWLTLVADPPDGFEQPDFDDSTWDNATSFGKFGADPWGTDITFSDPFTEHPAPLLRKEFNVPSSLSFARLYYSVGGFAHITLNGNFASDRVLTPGFTKYNMEVQSVTLDVKDLLVQGGNAIGVELGRSHYGITQPTRAGWESVPWHAEPSVRIVLSLGFEDGTTSRIVSDSSWKFIEGSTRLDDIFGGENYDATQEVPGFDVTGFDDSAWDAVAVVPGPNGTIVSQIQPPARFIETLSPVNITQPVPHIYVVAFERNIVAVTNLTLTGPAGTLITVHCGEKLKNDSTVAWEHVSDTYFNNYQTDRFWLAGTGKEESFQPKFSWKGFQYLQIEGWPNGSEPTVDNFLAKTLHDDMSPRGGFHSSSDLLNDLHVGAVHTLLHNSHSYPQDCPTYEKNGWSGDAVLSTDSFLSNLDAQNFLSKYVRDLDDSRTDPGTIGSPQVIAPSGGVISGIRAPPWHAAFILIPEFLHMYRGDLRTIETHYESMKAYVNIELDRSPGNIADTTFGDWLTSEVSPLGGNPPENTTVPATAFMYKMFTSMINIANLLNKTDDAATFTTQAASIKSSFNDNFFNDSVGHYTALGDANYRQSHNILSLAFNLSEAENMQSVSDSITDDIRNRSTHMNTGALSTKFVLPVLSEHGHADLAFEVATQTTFPSWGFWIENGATTMWETWAVAARSHDHHFLGTFEDWLYMHVLGIKATSPAFQTVTIAPLFTSQLSSGDGWMLTPFGNLTVRWTNSTGSDFKLDVTVPVGVNATIVVPKTNAGDTIRESGRRLDESEGVSLLTEADRRAEVAVGSGSYSFGSG